MSAPSNHNVREAGVLNNTYAFEKPQTIGARFHGSEEMAEGPANPRSRLTPRESQVVQLLAEGKTSKEVGVELGISVKTAETHRANIMRKLGLHSVGELVRYAIRNKIIEA